jgi:hypothetical protein
MGISIQPSPAEIMMDTQWRMWNISTVCVARWQMRQDVLLKLNPGFSWQKQHSTREDSFHQQIWLKFKEETSKVSFHAGFEAQLCMVLKLRHFGKYIRNAWNTKKCAPGEEFRISVWPIVLKLRNITQIQAGRHHPTYYKTRKGNWIGHIMCSNCFLNKLIQIRWKRREDKEEDISSYRQTLRKKEYTRNWKRKRQISLRRELALKKVRTRCKTD